MLKHLGTRGLAPQRGARPERGQPRASVRSFRPRLEILESRVYPGDTILGLWALALWAPSFASPDGATGSYRAQSEREWQRGLLSPLDVAASFSAFALLQDSAGALDGGGSAGDRVATLGTTSRADSPLFIDDILAGRVAGHRLGIPALPGSQALSVNFIGTPAGPGAPWSGVSAAFFAAAFAGTLTRSASSASDASLAGGASPLSTRSNLSFDTASGQLAIRANAGEHTVREALAADGFVDVTFDGQHHSSNPSSVSFDRALAGASGATVAGIRFDGGGQDTLILGSQHLAGGFRVQATGATVVTENVVTAGPLAIRAPNITVSGALGASTIALAASSWVNVDALGRIDAVPSARRAGGVSPLITIEIAADVFVNSGQLHADGPSGGQIIVQAGKVLNAGPITADGAGPGTHGGQVHIAFTDSYVATTAAVMSASNTAGPGGHLTIDGGKTGHLFSSGRHQVTGSVGGTVDLFGRDVVLVGATLDASGQTGGGSVRIGSGHSNAQTVTVTPATTIQANALRSGSGGQAMVGSDQTTTFDAAVSARGGPAGGPCRATSPS